MHNARKRMPPKVAVVPYFPMVREGVVRKGFLTDDNMSISVTPYLLKLKALFITAFLTGIRKGELLAIEWRQVDFDSRLITLERDATKGKEARSVQIIKGTCWNCYRLLERNARRPDTSSIGMASRSKIFAWHGALLV
jgi:integrase